MANQAAWSALPPIIFVDIRLVVKVIDRVTIRLARNFTVFQSSVFLDNALVIWLRLDAGRVSATASSGLKSANG